jgi:DNA-binding XRE family transcriptional regulator
MPTKPVFSEEQYEVIHAAAMRVWRKHFKDQPKAQVKMALALGVSQQSVSKLLKGEYRPGLKVATEIAVLDGKESLEDLIGDFASPAPSSPALAARNDFASTFANLDICVQFFASSKHWSPWTIAAARAGFFGQADFAPPEWAGKLDALEKALERARKAS